MSMKSVIKLHFHCTPVLYCLGSRAVRSVLLGIYFTKYTLLDVYSLYSPGIEALVKKHRVLRLRSTSSTEAQNLGEYSPASK